jgi:hypothetical protein
MSKNYYSFLLRIFKVGCSPGEPWLATLQEPHSHKEIHFPNLERLHVYLTTLDQPPEAEQPNSSKSGDTLRHQENNHP